MNKKLVILCVLLLGSLFLHGFQATQTERAINGWQHANSNAESLTEDRKTAQEKAERTLQLAHEQTERVLKLAENGQKQTEKAMIQNLELKEENRQLRAHNEQLFKAGQRLTQLLLEAEAARKRG